MSSITGQCTVTAPTITGSNLDDICLVASQETLSYTCTNVGSALFWNTTSSVLDGKFNIIAGESISVPPSQSDGVNLSETHNGDVNCVNSTLTFSGSLASLRSALNGSMLRCNDPMLDLAIVIMRIPGM